MHIYIHISTLTSEITFLTLINFRPVIIAAQYNYMILVPIPSTFSDAGQVYVCAYRYVCLCIEKNFLCFSHALLE